MHVSDEIRPAPRTTPSAVLWLMAAVVIGGSGLLLCLLAVLSLKAWKSGPRGASTPYTLASAALAAGLTAMMTKRYLASGSVFPPGVFAVLSGAMLLFYIYNLAAGGKCVRSPRMGHQPAGWGSQPGSLRALSRGFSRCLVLTFPGMLALSQSHAQEGGLKQRCEASS